MADLQTLERALRNADRAGDASAARRFAQEIVKSRGQEAGGASEIATVLDGGTELPGVGTAEDAGRGFLSGLRQGVEGLLGTPGDARELQGNIAGFVAGKLGASEGTQQSVGNIASRLSPFPTSPPTSDIRKVSSELVGSPYQPQTTTGEYARTIGEFAPAAAMGPGGIARKAALTTMPAIASETAGQLTKESEYEPYARLAGALAGGIAAAGRSPNAAKIAAKGAPTGEQLKAQTDELYGALRKVGIKYDPKVYAQTVQNIATDLKKQGFRKSTAPEAFAIVDDLVNDIGKGHNFDDINALVQRFGEVQRDLVKVQNKTASSAVGIIRDRLMGFEEAAPIVSKYPIPRELVNQVRHKARETAFKNIKSRVLDELTENATTYQAGEEAGLRNQISNLLRSKRGKQLFNGEERKVLLEVAKGRKSLQTLSRFGFDVRSFGGNASFLPAAGAATSYSAAGPAGLILPAAGTVAKELSPRLTRRAFDMAQSAIRSGKLRDRSVLSQLDKERLQLGVRRVLALDNAVSPIREQYQGSAPQ